MKASCRLLECRWVVVYCIYMSLNFGVHRNIYLQTPVVEDLHSKLFCIVILDHHIRYNLLYCGICKIALILLLRFRPFRHKLKLLNLCLLILRLGDKAKVKHFFKNYKLSVLIVLRILQRVVLCRVFGYTCKNCTLC